MQGCRLRLEAARGCNMQGCAAQAAGCKVAGCEAARALPARLQAPISPYTSMSNTVQNQVREFKTTSTCQIRQIKDSTHNVVCHLVCEVVETSMGSNLRVVDISPQGGFRVQLSRSGWIHFTYNPDVQKIVAPDLQFDYVCHVVVQVLYSSGPTRQKKRHEPTRAAR